MYTLEGVSSVANFITGRVNKTETPISVCSVYFVSKGNLLDFYFNTPIAEKALLIKNAKRQRHLVSDQVIKLASTYVIHRRFCLQWSFLQYTKATCHNHFCATV